MNEKSAAEFAVSIFLSVLVLSLAFLLHDCNETERLKLQLQSDEKQCQCEK